jgi:hypothetical protein
MVDAFETSVIEVGENPERIACDRDGTARAVSACQPASSLRQCQLFPEQSERFENTLPQSLAVGDCAWRVTRQMPSSFESGGRCH